MGWKRWRDCIIENLVEPAAAGTAREVEPRYVGSRCTKHQGFYIGRLVLKEFVE